MRHPCKFQCVSRIGSVTARQSSSGHQPNFAALNRGRHLYSAGRPSRWAFAHILVTVIMLPPNIPSGCSPLCRSPNIDVNPQSAALLRQPSIRLNYGRSSLMKWSAVPRRKRLERLSALMHAVVATHVLANRKLRDRRPRFVSICSRLFRA